MNVKKVGLNSFNIVVFLFTEKLDMVYEQALTISVKQLKKAGALHDGKVTKKQLVYDRDREIILTVDVTVDMSGEFPYVVFKYPDKTSYVDLYKRQDNLVDGHYCYLFVCPQTLKRAYKLYYFGHEFLHKDAYPRAVYGIHAVTRSQRWFIQYDKAIEDRIAKPYYRPVYKGKPTSTAKRIDKKQAWLEASLDVRFKSLLS